MEILSEKEFEGSVTFEVELTEEETDLLILAGLQKMIEESDLPIVAVKASKKMKINNDAKTHDLSEEETAFLVNQGFNKVIKDYLDKMDKEDERED